MVLPPLRRTEYATEMTPHVNEISAPEMGVEKGNEKVEEVKTEEKADEVKIDEEKIEEKADEKVDEEKVDEEKAEEEKAEEEKIDEEKISSKNSQKTGDICKQVDVKPGDITLAVESVNETK